MTAMAVPAPLSDREEEVLGALADHLTNAQIAQQLHISVRTVESHVSSLLRKLGAADRRELAAVAADQTSAAATGGYEVVGLPNPWTSFVGRESTLADIDAALGEHRLVTLLGPGGIGKTRLATVAAERAAVHFNGGGAFVDLVPVSAEFVVQAIAAALDVVERPQEPLERVVFERLRAGRVLLVLDNCEHVSGAVAALVPAALAACPSLVVLATSRERLGIVGERVVPILPLSVAGLASEAERLFVDRAAGAGAGVAEPGAVSAICERLDGVPLAIELAAARSASLGYDGLASALDDHLRVLSTASGPGSGGRHRSLRAVIDWSHDLLDEEEQVVFRRLSIFTGRFDLAAATDVMCDGDIVGASDVIGRLTDKSLLVHRSDATGSRWRMLETIHAYARERLEASEDLAGTRCRHLAWAAATARRLEQSIDDSTTWPAHFDVVADDLRAALVPAADTCGGDAFELAGALAHLTYARRFLLEAHDHFATAVRLAPDDVAAADALTNAADAYLAELRGEVAFWLLRRASDRAARAGDPARAAIALADAATIAGCMPATFQERLSRTEIEALVAEVRAMAPPGDRKVAAHATVANAFCAYSGRGEADPEIAEEALRLAREIDDPVLLSRAIDAVVSTATATGRHRDGLRLTAERVNLLGRLPRHHPRSGVEVVDVYHTGVEAALAAGRLEEAVAHARLAHQDNSNRPGLTHFGAGHFVVPLVLQGSFDEALDRAAAMRDGWERAGQPVAGWMTPAFYAAALAFGLLGDEPGLLEWWALADRVQRHSRSTAFQQYAAIRLALHRDEVDLAGLVPWVRPSATSRFDDFPAAATAEAAVVAGAPDAEQQLRALVPLAAENDFVAACLARAEGRLWGDEQRLAEAVTLWESIGARFERASTLVLLPARAAEGRRELAALGCALVKPSAIGATG